MMKLFSFLVCLFSIFLAGTVHAQWVGDSYFNGMIPPSEAWDGSFAFGLNGKTGNSENVNINLEFAMNCETERVVTDLVCNYFYGRDEGTTNADRTFAQARQDRKLANPNLSWYYSGAYDRDRFRDFDFRVSLHSGLGALLYKFDDRSLRARMGAGTSREFGGQMDEWIPELQFGFDWERKLTKRTRLYTNFDLFPNVEELSDYRLNLRAGFETLLDEALDMRLRAFVFNQYDSQPGAGFNGNDLNYGLALVFGF